MYISYFVKTFTAKIPEALFVLPLYIMHALVAAILYCSQFWIIFRSRGSVMSIGSYFDNYLLLFDLSSLAAANAFITFSTKLIETDIHTVLISCLLLFQSLTQEDDD